MRFERLQEVDEGAPAIILAGQDSGIELGKREEAASPAAPTQNGQAYQHVSGVLGEAFYTRER